MQVARYWAAQKEMRLRQTVGGRGVESLSRSIESEVVEKRELGAMVVFCAGDKVWLMADEAKLEQVGSRYTGAESDADFLLNTVGGGRWGGETAVGTLGFEFVEELMGGAEDWEKNQARALFSRMPMERISRQHLVVNQMVANGRVTDIVRIGVAMFGMNVGDTWLEGHLDGRNSGSQWRDINEVTEIAMQMLNGEFGGEVASFRPHMLVLVARMTGAIGDGELEELNSLTIRVGDELATEFGAGVCEGVIGSDGKVLEGAEVGVREFLGYDYQ